ncbi:MAG: cobalamin biosynthesis protein [Thermodesulfobacteriota bacterium]
MKIALITLSAEGARVADHIADGFPEARVYLHTSVEAALLGERFESILNLSEEIFDRFEGLVYIAPCGVAVRAIAPLLKHKTVDPAVVVVDVCGRFAISLLSGHERGANDLAFQVANLIDAEPIVTTTTEASKNLVVGIGCRRGTASKRIVEAIKVVLADADLGLDQVRLLASADIKANEAGLLEAARELGIPLRFISSEEIRACKRAFQRSDWVQQKVNLPAVAEPAALLAGRRTTLLVPKKSHHGITIAVARENCSS